MRMPSVRRVRRSTTSRVCSVGSLRRGHQGRCSRAELRPEEVSRLPQESHSRNRGAVTSRLPIVRVAPRAARGPRFSQVSGMSRTYLAPNPYPSTYQRLRT